MPYIISACCDIGPILSRRVVPQRAVKQARDYGKLGYTQIAITDVRTGEVYDANGLAALIQAQVEATTPG